MDKLKEQKIKRLLRPIVETLLTELGETDAEVTNIGNFKVGDFIQKAHRSGETKGFVYRIHPTGHFVKLQDRYGNIADKWIDPRGFKLVKRPPTRVEQ